MRCLVAGLGSLSLITLTRLEVVIILDAAGLHAQASKLCYIVCYISADIANV